MRGIVLPLLCMCARGKNIKIIRMADQQKARRDGSVNCSVYNPSAPYIFFMVVFFADLLSLHLEELSSLG